MRAWQPVEMTCHPRTMRCVSSRRGRMAHLPLLLAATALLLPARDAKAVEPVPVAVADFDYTDTSGELADQIEAHRARVATFGELVRASLAEDGKYRVVRLDCPEHACTAANMRPDDFVAEARRAGARLVVYGGIRKMSTLVQWGEVQLLDLDRSELLLRRTVTFRGDNDAAFRRAAAFVGETLKDVMP
jgi:uncharacterized protein DUF2380